MKKRFFVHINAGLLAAMSSHYALGAAQKPVSVPSGQVGAIRPDVTARCDDPTIAPFMNARASEKIGAKIMRATGAAALQWLAPGQPVTRDLHPSRVRVFLNKDRLIIRIMCG